MEDLLYCRCCLSTSSPLYKVMKDSLLIAFYRVLLGYQERHEELPYVVCSICKHLLYKLSAFQDVCRKADLFINKYKAQHMNDKNNHQTSFIETYHKLSSCLPQLKRSGTQSVDIPAEDRLLIRRRPVNVVTLPQPDTTSSRDNKESNQITLSFKNPVDVDDDEENTQCDSEDLMFKSTDLNVMDDDNYFDFTIVVKNNIEDEHCHKCKTSEINEMSTKAVQKCTNDEHNSIINTNNEVSNDALFKDMQHNGITKANESDNVLYKTKNGVVSLCLNDVSVTENVKILTEDGINLVSIDSVLDDPCSDNEGDLDVKLEVTEDFVEEYEELDQSNTEDICFVNDQSILTKTEDQSIDDLHKIATAMSQTRRSKKIKHKLKLKKKIKSGSKIMQKKRYPCEICGLVFDLAIHLEIHNSTHTGLSSFVCDLCCRAFPLKSTLEKHMQCHSCDRKRYKCELCPKTFIFKKLLYKHKFKHTNESKPYVCSICSRGFVFENELKKHTLLHTDIRPFSCSKCPKKFTQKAFLSQHLLTHVEGELYICDICGKGFSQNAKLSYHRKTHLDIKPYQCDLCPRSFVRSGQLKTHKIYHSNERPWICEHCGRSFRVKGALTAHRRVHSGARPYECDICHRSYTEAGYLKKHKRIHSGIKPFSCDICGRAFNETCTLARHKLTHTDERKHVCKECGGRFKYSGCLNKHIQRKHNTTRPQ